MGMKDAAKKLMIAAGVPVTPAISARTVAEKAQGRS
jgi:biotin carboxylase